ncbi:hypothetical protein BKA56DRAFT_623836 [Ilyonectria sp. MPI-CAGE-AT-0026]|nr:hypothetical protein BKA56DRAFT_623836 [Ilyonectria sp. MPI-CAGE-AT-0026]
MAQVGVLGNLQYKSTQHSWALDLGTSLAQYEMLHNNLTDETMPGIEQSRLHSVRFLNQTLSFNNIQYTVPAITVGLDSPISDVTNNIFQQMKSKHSPAHVAFALLGGADYLFSLAVSSNPNFDDNVRHLAHNRIMKIPLLCEGIEVNMEALIGIMCVPPFGSLPLREKLNAAIQPIKILFIAADPINANPLGLLEECKTLEQLLSTTIISNAFKVEHLFSCTIKDLSQGLLMHKPTILHFSGHGRKDGLCFRGDDGTVRVVDQKALAKLLGIQAKNYGLKGAMLNACWSDEQAPYIADAVGSVIGMQGPVSDRDATSFTREFYQALGSGMSFEKAFEWAVAATGIDPDTSKLQPRLVKQTSQ